MFDHVIVGAGSVGRCTAELKPTSKGNVSFRSARPDAKPRTDREDRRSVIQGIPTSMRVAQKAALGDVTRKAHLIPASGRDADNWEPIKRVVQTCYHPTSTCTIGSVLDPEPRVFGMDGLRVVDASVMPSVIRGNTNAPTILIAKRVTDMIRGSVQ